MWVEGRRGNCPCRIHHLPHGVSFCIFAPFMVMIRKRCHLNCVVPSPALIRGKGLPNLIGLAYPRWQMRLLWGNQPQRVKRRGGGVATGADAARCARPTATAQSAATLPALTRPRQSKRLGVWAFEPFGLRQFGVGLVQRLLQIFPLIGFTLKRAVDPCQLVRRVP